VALLVWIGFAWRDARRRARYVDALRAEPGLVVVSTDRRGGQFVVSGLRDPLARDPETLVAASGLAPGDVRGEWAPFHALNPPIVLARARDVLQPPRDVTLTLADGVLSATGPVTVAWVAEARRRAPFVAGVRSFDAAAALAGPMQTARDAIDRTAILFVKGSARPSAGQNESLGRLVIHMQDLDALAAATGRRLRVAIAGHTDADGPDASNLPLSRARAEFVRDRLAGMGLAHVDLVVTGEGSRQPAVVSADEAGKQQNRRVTLRVTAETEGAKGGRP
jgi:OOP family OmpA-OmpF porin